MELDAALRAGLAYQHQHVASLIAGLGENRLRTRVFEQKWSAFEQLVHLAAYQPIFAKRIELILANEEPIFQPYVAESDPRFHEVLSKKLEDVLQILINGRDGIVTRLSSLSSEMFDYVGIHMKYGRLPLTEWIRFYLLHEAHHLYSIYILTQALR